MIKFIENGNILGYIAKRCMNLLIVWFILFNVSFHFEIKLENRNINSSYDIYVNETMNEYFQYDKNDDICDCSPKNIFYVLADDNSTVFSMISGKTENEGEEAQVKVSTSNEELIDISYTLEKEDSGKLLKISHHCSGLSSSNNISNWGIITVDISFPSEKNISFDFVKMCQQPELMGSIMTTIIIFLTATLFVYLATKSEIRLELTEIKPEGEIKCWHGIVLVLCGSIVLMLIFYFVNYFILNLLFTGIVTCQISMASYLTLKAFYENLKLHKKWKSLNKIIISDFEAYSLITLFITGALVALYLITRHWLLNNIFGFFLIFTILSLYHIRSFKICAILLILAFFYDIFWVYFSPFLFTDNVMVVAATRLNLPIKLELPIFFQNHPLKSCMFLGLGDIVLPGFVVKFCKRFDFLKSTNIYYPCAICFYIISLILSGLVVYIFNYPQPVLFYMCPVLLLGIFFIARKRKECKDIWKADKLEDNLQIIDSNFNSKNSDVDQMNISTNDSISDIEIGPANWNKEADLSLETSTESNSTDENK